MEKLILASLATLLIGFYGGWKIKEQGIKSDVEDERQLQEEEDERMASGDINIGNGVGNGVLDDKHAGTL